MFKKGSVVFRDVGVACSLLLIFADTEQYELVEPGTHDTEAMMDDLAEPAQLSKKQAESDRKKRAKARMLVEHLDIIKDDFWDRRPWLLSGKPGKIPKET